VAMEEDKLPQEADAEDERPSKRVAALVLGGLALVFLMSFLYEPAPVGPDRQYFTLCAFKNFTGLPCPGCGLTHSFCAIGKADLGQALSFNLLGPPLFLFAALMWLRSAFVVAGWTHRACAIDRAVARFKPVRTFAIAFLVFGVGRIAYLFIYEPWAVRNCPLVKMFALLAGP
jgi:uncharacterized protein DUF2752